jgi:hypothetical protein
VADEHRLLPSPRFTVPVEATPEHALVRALQRLRVRLDNVVAHVLDGRVSRNLELLDEPLQERKAHAALADTLI